MVTQERKYVAIPEVEKIIKESNTPEEAVNKLHNLHKRQTKPPAPEGGISLREAERKYKIDHSVFSRWVNKGWVKILRETKNWLYIDEGDLVRTIKERRHNGG